MVLRTKSRPSKLHFILPTPRGHVDMKPGGETLSSLSDSDRTGHLPKLFDDLLCRLRPPRDSEPPVSIAASAHGGLRFAQGYSASMLVEESRIFQVTTFGTLHLHQSELDQNQVLQDVMIIADEADGQLTETVRGFMTAQTAAA
jgi:hypothetical protein